MSSESVRPKVLDPAELLGVLLAVKGGDFGARMPPDRTGLVGKVADTLNEVIQLNEALARELVRVSTVAGKEGRTSQRATLGGAPGAWAACIEAVNDLVVDLVQPTERIARVIGAVAHGDLSQTMSLEIEGRTLTGEFLRTAQTVNTMVDQLNGFASEVTRVVREVGTEGQLGGQARVLGVSGTWKDLTDSVNGMAGNLTAQVRNIAAVTTAVANGDLSKKITVDVRGEMRELKDTINTMVDQLNGFASEVTRVEREVGTEGQLGGQARVPGVSGTWKDLTDGVNGMASNLTAQVRNIALVTTAVANGDLSKKITADARGEILELKDTINTMVNQLNSFASEVTRVAREVGTEGKLGGQARVPGVSGTWKDLTDGVNGMASNLTAHVRGIARVVTSVANGDLGQELVLEAKGEIAELAETINAMIDTLATFADQVTGVAREVGIEGRLGGQARVPGASGTWRDLTDNVNRLAANLTTQVRAIAEVATAVTKGDLSRSIAVDAAGEVAALKDNLNEMIRNLRDTTAKNTEQDWLKTNLAKFTRMLQGQRDQLAVAKLVLSELAPLVTAQHGIFYLNEAADGLADLRLLASYAFSERKHLANRYREGEGLVGQVAYEKQRILLTRVPDDYIKIGSGLGEATPANIVVLPVLFEGRVRAVIELASFDSFSPIHLTFLDQLTESIGIVLNTIATNRGTEELLEGSQSLTQELRQRQEELQRTNERLEQQAHSLRESEQLLKEQREELQQTNEELEEKAQLLSRQNAEVERTNREIELAKQDLEEKARQLAMTSKYKSEFLANMSHELRTPLNSLLILSNLLAQNAEGNLTDKQVEGARTIHSSGSDLLALINEILDLAKIESGRMEVDVREVGFDAVRDYLERQFRPVAEQKRLDFAVEMAADLPRSIATDAPRLQQVLRNLLANAFKFTERGRVALRIGPASGGWSSGHPTLDRAERVVAFAVADTGIGIPAEKHRVIFEAFQQADGTTSRRYGGTGLGLAISREVAGLLGGEIAVASSPGRGSTFTLYLPLQGPRPPHGDGPGRPAATDRAAAPAPARSPRPAAVDVPDDRSALAPDDRVLLIIDDDATFAGLLLDQAHQKGFKGVVALDGEGGLALAREIEPDAIVLDIRLPGMDGWTVLDRLKHDSKTRHIPVHIISAVGGRNRGLRQGALSYLEKPATAPALDEALAQLRTFVERRVRSLLVVEDDEAQRTGIVELLGDGDIETTAVRTGEEALEALQRRHFDCMVLDLGLPDMPGLDLIERIRGEPALARLPIVVYTGKVLDHDEQIELERLADTVILKGASSPERLLDETALFLHRVESDLTPSKRQMLEQVHLTDPVLEGKKVLIVDDDARNAFALTSALEQHGLVVSYAENGRDGIKLLEEGGINVVLMDVMLPEMDGYEATREIRRRREFRSLPVIALTAKAMKGDREKCIESGASDYISKPVNVEQLLSLLRVWLYR